MERHVIKLALYNMKVLDRKKKEQKEWQIN